MTQGGEKDTTGARATSKSMAFEKPVLSMRRKRSMSGPYTFFPLGSLFYHMPFYWPHMLLLSFPIDKNKTL
jgi:hypothetical protein